MRRDVRPRRKPQPVLSPRRRVRSASSRARGLRSDVQRVGVGRVRHPCSLWTRASHAWRRRERRRSCARRGTLPWDASVGRFCEALGEARAERGQSSWRRHGLCDVCVCARLSAVNAVCRCCLLCDRARASRDSMGRLARGPIARRRRGLGARRGRRAEAAGHATTDQNETNATRSALDRSRCARVGGCARGFARTWLSLCDETDRTADARRGASGYRRECRVLSDRWISV